MSMEGSKYSDEKAILKDAFQRMVGLLKLNHAADGANPSSYVLTGVNIAVHSTEDEVTCPFDMMNC
jgi:hexosaminidase